MPRGTRAVHEFAGRQHGSRSEPLVAFIPAAVWLRRECLCGRSIVAALQCDVVDCIPTSCGRDDCDGVPTPLIVTSWGVNDDNFDDWVEARIAEGVPLSEQPKVRRRRSKVKVVARRTFAARHPEAAESRSHRVAWRREDVAQHWREGKRPADIARALDLPGYLVANDLTYLRAHGRLAR